MGHEERFPRPRPSDRCRFEEETFAGASANGRDAPIADLHSTRAWGMPLDYRLSYASLPEAG
jgi:hypothetical protein